MDPVCWFHLRVSCVDSVSCLSMLVSYAGPVCLFLVFVPCVHFLCVGSMYYFNVLVLCVRFVCLFLALVPCVVSVC